MSEDFRRDPRSPWWTVALGLVVGGVVLWAGARLTQPWPYRFGSAGEATNSWGPPVTVLASVFAALAVILGLRKPPR
jgi:hypothetical protein